MQEQPPSRIRRYYNINRNTQSTKIDRINQIQSESHKQSESEGVCQTNGINQTNQTNQNQQESIGRLDQTIITVLALIYNTHISGLGIKVHQKAVSQHFHL